MEYSDFMFFFKENKYYTLKAPHQKCPYQYFNDIDTYNTFAFLNNKLKQTTMTHIIAPTLFLSQYIIYVHRSLRPSIRPAEHHVLVQFVDLMSQNGEQLG